MAELRMLRFEIRTNPIARQLRRADRSDRSDCNRSEATTNLDSDPFSLDFQIAAVSGHLGALPRPGAATTASVNAVSRALELAQTSRSLLAAALGEGRAGSRPEGMPPSSVAMLQTALAPLQALLPEISNLLTRAYFDHVVAQPA